MDRGAWIRWQAEDEALEREKGGRASFLMESTDGCLLNAKISRPAAC